MDALPVEPLAVPIRHLTKVEELQEVLGSSM